MIEKYLYQERRKGGSQAARGLFGPLNVALCTRVVFLNNNVELLHGTLSLISILCVKLLVFEDSLRRRLSALV